MKTTSELLTGFNLGDLKLANRVVLAPMTRARAGKERTANALMAEYYVQRANAGLIIAEATAISEQASGWVNSPGIYVNAHTAGWKIVTDAVHQAGTPIFLQLWHCGRTSHSSFHGGKLAVSASAIKINGDYLHTPVGKQPYETPRALETEEVAAVVQDYRRAAERARQQVSLAGILPWLLPLAFVSPPELMLLLSGILLLLVVFLLWWIGAYSRTIRYCFTPTDIAWEKGVWFHQTGSIPYNLITSTEIIQGPVSRSFGISLLTIRIADAVGSAPSRELKIRGITNAGMLKEYILARIQSSS